MALQAKYDAKLAKSGFRDIEYGQDTNMIDGSTFRGVSERPTDTNVRGGGAEFILGLPDSVAEVTPNVFHSPRARAWALFSQAANDLPTDARTRRLLLEVAETGNQAEVARRRRIAPERLSELVRRLCDAIGVESRNLFGSVTEMGHFSGSVESATRSERDKLKVVAVA